MSNRFTVVGLGNPGIKYKKTRHNIGFMVINQLAQEFNTHLYQKKGLYETGEFSYNNNLVILAKPLTFMNNSGQVVSQIVHYYKIVLSHLLIIIDDVELPLGRIRIRPKGSSGGHNGLKSIINHLDTPEFARLRIGIGSEYAKKDMTKFVLSNFSRNEQKEVHSIINLSCESIKSFIDDGIDKTMNKYNSI